MARIEVKVLGVPIGTADGWDEMGVCCICMYDYVPYAHIDLDFGDLMVDYTKGKFTIHDDETGEVVKEYSILAVLGDLE